MLAGTVYLTNDLEMVRASVYNNCRVVALTENIQSINIQDISNITPATILLPPYQAVMAELDGDIQSFYNMYGQHLGSKEADAYICLIITALARGINILLYVPKDESELAFSSALMQYIQMTYGVTIGTPNIQFDYNQMFNAIVCTRLYFHDLISYKELLVSYPAEVNLDVSIIPHLMFDLAESMPTMHGEAEYFKFFNDYKNSIKQNNNVFLTKTIVKGDKRC